MPDPLSTIVSAAASGKTIDAMGAEAAKTTARLWEKVLGPPAEAIGDHLRSRIEMWSEDSLARKVLERAAQKSNLDEPGTVPPRVAADIFEKAQWADDEFVAEYLSGVLASARTPGGADDSGVSWTALVGRMSAAQIRLHYILYATARHHLLGREIDGAHILDNLPIFTPLMPILESLGGPDQFNDAIMNLTREGLVSDRMDIDPKGARVAAGKVVPHGPALIYRINTAGVMLFMRGGGTRHTLVKAITDPGTELRFQGVREVPVPVPHSGLLSELPDLPTSVEAPADHDGSP